MIVRQLSFIFILLLLVSCSKKSDKAVEGFEVNPAFNIELVVSEPLVFDPVEMQFSSSGEAYVLEMPGYPFGESSSRIVHLKDNNKDGIYDEREVYAEDLGVASSFMFYDGGILVAAPPNLLWIADEDGDGKADERVVLMDGFSNDNLQHNFNGLIYGLDNWIYAANGGNSGAPFFLSKPDEVLQLRGGDLRFNLEDEILQRVGESSGGFKIAFDSWGRLFETHNLEHVSQLVFEDRYFSDMPVSPAHALVNISDHDENGLSRIYPIGEQDSRVNHPEQSGYFSGACGITYYGGGIFPETLDHSLLVADCVLNLVHIDLLKDNASLVTTSRAREKVEFLASTDRSFRPVNMTVGPDGALYVLDMHRDVIEHPEWIPDDIEATLDLDAGKDKGRIYRITPKDYTYNTPVNLDEYNLESLVAALGDDNQWIRRNAQQMLVTADRKDGISLLENQLGSPNAYARLHSLWTLEGLGALSDEELIDALDDEHEGVVENAVKIVEKRLKSTPEFVQLLLRKSTETENRAKLQVALTLSTLNGDEYNNVKTGLVTTYLNELQNSELDIWNVRAISFVLKNQAKEVARLQLEKDQNLNPNELEVLQLMVKVSGKENTSSDIAILLQEIYRSTLSTEKKALMISSLSEGYALRQEKDFSTSEKNTIVRALTSLEEINEISIIRTSGEFRLAMGVSASQKVNDYLPVARKNLLDEVGSPEEQLSQLQLVGLSDYKYKSDLLYALLNNKRPIALQRESLKQLWNSNEKEVGPKLLELWPTLGPEARKHSTDILLYKSFNHDPLLTAMENGDVNLGEFNLDLERRRVLLFSDDEAIRERAAALFSDSGIVQRQDAIDAMTPALALKGTPLAGKEVFVSQCASCHIYNDIGNKVGPVLTEISRKSKESLLHEILDPNAAVDTKYLNYKIVTSDGNIYFGLVNSETDTELTLAITGGNTISINKSNIESFSSTGKSLMPEGLESAMNEQNMADLLSFLQEGI